MQVRLTFWELGLVYLSSGESPSQCCKRAIVKSRLLKTEVQEVKHAQSNADVNTLHQVLSSGCKLARFGSVKLPREMRCFLRTPAICEILENTMR